MYCTTNLAVQEGVYNLQSSPQGIVAEWTRAPDSSSGVSDQQSSGSSPGIDTCVLKQDTNHYCPESCDIATVSIV